MLDRELDKNWPFPFYICGERMPRFGAMWHWIGYGPEDGPGTVVEMRAQDVLFAIDHDFHSEDAGVVDICAQGVLYALLEGWDRHIEETQAYLDREELLDGQGISAKDALTDLRETLFRTIELTRIHPVIWWTNTPLEESRLSYDQEAAVALAFEGDSDDSPWPHRTRIKFEIEIGRDKLRRFRQLSYTRKWDRGFRKRLQSMGD